jgi:hypothetical protein
MQAKHNRAHEKQRKKKERERERATGERRVNEENGPCGDTGEWDERKQLSSINITLRM